MPIRPAVLLTLALTLAASLPAQAGKDGHAPLHGGIVVETNAFDIELTVKPDLVRVYLRDHGKPVAMDGTGGKITLLAGGVKTEAPLSLAGDALEARGTFKTAGAKAVVVITRPGKAPVTARFTLK